MSYLDLDGLRYYKDKRDMLFGSVLGVPRRIYNGNSCVDAFVEAMNNKASLLGMEDSGFVNPTGLSTNNSTSVLDMLKLGMASVGYSRLIRAMSTKGETVYINGTAREITHGSMVAADSIITNANVLAIKGGNLASTYRTQIDIVDIDDRACVLCVLGVDVSDYDNIYSYCNDLAGVVKERIETGEYTVPQSLVGLVSRHGAYAAIELPANTMAYENHYPTAKLKARQDVIYGGEQNICIPCSITKVLSAMVLIDTMPDFNVDITIQQTDIVGGSGIGLEVGDKLTAHDAFLLSFLPSDNNAMTALARTCGNILLNRRYEE